MECRAKALDSWKINFLATFFIKQNENKIEVPSVLIPRKIVKKNSQFKNLQEKFEIKFLRTSKLLEKILQLRRFQNSALVALRIIATVT